MSSAITRELYEGNSVSFPEFADRVAHWVGPLIGVLRDASLDTTIPDALSGRADADGEHAAKRFREKAAELAVVASWSQEEADAHAHRHNLTALKHHIRSIRDSREKRKIFAHMSAQVAAWQPPTEEHEIMRTAMQEQLDKTFELDLSKNLFALPPEKLTGTEFREMQLHYLTRDVLEAKQEMDVSVARNEQVVAFAEEYSASLQGWVDVPAPSYYPQLP